MAFKIKREERLEGRRLTCGEPGEPVESDLREGVDSGSKRMSRKSFTGFLSDYGGGRVNLPFGGKLHEFECVVLLLSPPVPF
jgi:hypothetical protein